MVTTAPDPPAALANGETSAPDESRARRAGEPELESLPARIVFFDGVCAFCDHAVRWLQARDPRGRFHFAPLQGDTPVQFVLTGRDEGKIDVRPSEEVVTITDPGSNKVTFTATGSRLPSHTRFDIVQGDMVLQSLDVHTSCSAPLAIGDQFGGVILRTYVPEQP